MRSAYLTEVRHFEVRQEGIPVLKDNEVLVKIAYCGICTLEQRLYTGERKIYYPIIPGHEASGIVVTVGSEVITGVQVHDHVALDLVNRCHACPACLSGNSNLCENRFKEGQRVLGAFSDYMVVKPDQLQVVPSDLPLESVAFAEPLACCIRSLRTVNASLGDTILISGVGTMGILHIKVALAMGLRVIACDIDLKRLEDAKRLGAIALDASSAETCIATIKKITRGRGVDSCIITTSSMSAVEVAVAVLASNGVMNIYTSYGNKPPLPLDMNTIHRHEFVVTGSEGRSEYDFYTATRVLANRTIVVDDLISQIYPLEEVSTAVEEALSGSSYRVLLKMEE
ncbi:MAG: alcohol dehydrogenase catalytic domain-containing protein [Sphaerochaetaceae bacterium]|jgi:L-iditol 2-dehydrogenase|nr:alcohol dehydrogenase catalytic domain-containing protein [Sphaerochaetaceae bacterium]MDD4219040.1 alcohol dehydrogenase catalytic domain-containing protein [Sphaerochaetaceae bacterium]MDY0371326.1 alcohol dehydrogenase catalytic domain-containing protein [Sphaerochaetaceae bacterium]